MLALLIGIVALIPLDDTPKTERWWGDEVVASLDRLPERRAAWEALLQDAPPEQRAGYAYLIADLPEVDLETLDPAALAANIELAYQVRGEVPWGSSLPEEIFLDAVLPHASVTEPRDSMRAEFHDEYLPLVRDCKTPGEAMLKLNAALFRDKKVSYNTKRLRTDQCSRESIAQGMATCTGLSIMLVEAARAVGIPARVAGIASWPGRGGNHTWAEVWDDGWHFVGAAEPDPNGMDHAWFVGDAAKGIESEPRNAIWAVTYKATGSHFPLVWNRRATVNAENVTRRYADGPKPARPRLMVEVREGGERVAADVRAILLGSAETAMEGKSLGPQADVNLHLSTPADEGGMFLVAVRYGDRCAARVATVEGDTVVRVDLDRPVDKADLEAIKGLLADRFGDDDESRERAEKLLADIPFDESLRALAWEAFVASPMHEDLRAEWEAKTVKTADRTSPYLWRSVGDPDAKGRTLVIAMHGGGGAPKRVNDSQWNGMFERYYRDHPEAGDYVYLALRAPNDEWNGFYDDAIVPLVERLILQFVLFANVDPDKVYILGASHGGYGAFVIGPKAPDRFAAIHASASAPTPGETKGENLRNVRFTWMVGERDTAYGRAERSPAFAKEVEGWKEAFGGYPGGMEFLPGVGHSVPDRDKVAEMLKAGPREPHPTKVVWSPSDSVIHDCYWVEALEPVDGAKVVATAEDNTITLKAEELDRLVLWLDEPVIDPSKPVTIKVEGQDARTVTLEPDLGTFCDSLERRRDPRLAAPCRVEVDLKP